MTHPGESSAARSGMGRLIPAFLVGLALLGLSGCVYLRLLELKSQLEHFQENFAVSVDDGLTITCLHPVILEKDMWFIGLPPTVQNADAEGTDWIYVFEKRYRGVQREEADHDVRLTLRFEDRKLTRFGVGEELFAFIPKDAVLMTLSSLGRLDINLASRKAELYVDEGPGWDFPAPDRQDIVGTLGLPYSEAIDGARTTLVYSYTLRPSSPPSPAYKPEKHGLPYTFIIEFDSEDLISNITADFPFMGSIKIDYEDPVEE